MLHKHPEYFPTKKMMTKWLTWIRNKISFRKKLETQFEPVAWSGDTAPVTGRALPCRGGTSAASGTPAVWRCRWPGWATGWSRPAPDAGRNSGTMTSRIRALAPQPKKYLCYIFITIKFFCQPTSYLKIVHKKVLLLCFFLLTIDQWWFSRTDVLL